MLLRNGKWHGTRAAAGIRVLLRSKGEGTISRNTEVFYSVCPGLLLDLCGPVHDINAPIVNVFLTDPSALDYGVKFTRLILVSGFFMGVFCILMSMLQAIGAVKSSLFAALSREGIVYIPLVFILKAAFGLNGIVAAQPAAELISLVIVVFFVRHAIHTMPSKECGEIENR